MFIYQYGRSYDGPTDCLEMFVLSSLLIYDVFLDDFVGASLCSFVKGASPCISFNLVD